MRGRDDKSRKKPRQPAQTPPAKTQQPSLPERLLRLLTGERQHDKHQ